MVSRTRVTKSLCVPLPPVASQACPTHCFPLPPKLVPDVLSSSKVSKAIASHRFILPAKLVSMVFPKLVLVVVSTSKVNKATACHCFPLPSKLDTVVVSSPKGTNVSAYHCIRCLPRLFRWWLPAQSYQGRCLPLLPKLVSVMVYSHNVTKATASHCLCLPLPPVVSLACPNGDFQSQSYQRHCLHSQLGCTLAKL